MTTKTASTWQLVKLSEIADVRDGTHATPKKLAFGKPLITSKQLKQGEVMDTDYFISEDDYEEVNRRSRVDVNDVLITMIGTVGDTVFVKEKPNFAIKNIGLIKNSDPILGRFIYYWLNSPAGKHEIRKRLRGTSQGFISLGGLRDLDVLLPDADSQLTIVEALSFYDDLIEINNKRVRLLEGVISKIYTGWFSQSNDWNKVKLSECISISRGKSYTGKDLEDSEDSIPLVNLKCINRYGGFRKDGLKTFSGKYKESHIVRKGDMVMAVTDMTQERMIIARSARVPSLGTDFGVISMDLVKIEPKENCDRDFLYAYLRWSDFADNVKNYANGANVLHLLPDRVSEYEILLPPLELQKKFSLVVKDMFEQIDVLELACDNLKKTRDLLIPQLVTGKLAIKS